MLNEIYIKIEGLNLSRIAQKMINSGVFLSNLKIRNSYLLCSIKTSDKEKLEKILKRERKKYYILKNTKIKRFFAKIPYFIGTFLPILMLFAFFYKSYNIISSITISVENDKCIDVESINNILLNNNIIEGGSRYDLKTQDIEKIILKNAENIAGCSAKYSGRDLIITVYPIKQKEEKFQKELLSKYNAVITEINVFLGQTKFKVGDVVKTGDILISSETEAKGKVQGKVYFSVTKIYNERQDVLKETGNVFESEVLKLANLISIGKHKICDYLNYKLEKTTERLINNLFIPVAKEKFIYKELEVVEQIIPFDGVESEIKENLKQELFNQIPNNIEPKDVTYSIVREGTYVRVDCFIEAIIDLI